MSTDHENEGEDISEKLKNTLDRLFRTELAMMFLENIDKFGMYAQYYDMESLNLLDEKYLVLEQLDAGRAVTRSPDSTTYSKGCRRSRWKIRTTVKKIADDNPE